MVNDNSLHQQILELAHLICYNSFFQFNGITYGQGRGVPMGSPIAGDLCEIVVRQLEDIVIPQYSPNILLYKRYVDDILILWRIEPDVSRFVDSFNDNPYGLTLEIDQAHASEAHFLDINIKFEQTTTRTEVYRKPGAEHLYIPIGSCDPPNYKMAAFNALIRRAYSHSSDRISLHAELRHIEQIANEHGYPKIVRKLIRKWRCREVALNQAPKEVPSNIIPVTYNPYLKSIYNTIAKKKNIRIAYRRCATIFDILRNGKDTPNKERRPGVYTIPMIDHRWNRSLIYVGSTKRSLEVRIKEHMADILHARQNTALAVYASDTEIEPLFSQAKVIRTTKYTHHLRWLEALYICMATLKDDNCINNKDEIILSTAWQVLVDKKLR
ncbi:uncharacterized protein LOC111639639 [Centruroides sculpturatus]|nr:uncharacterized protein LOC111616579 [Centruroides sculpturatus]XP_023233689.1 uncharacterized protein LOC111633366 [Centruroides sculpturatus]XP_023233691.1 uncharacterized protein LOC111633366 [Centruroides sculpturatus]XP_023241307.1 uncharacterized protein LOC111639639 [Centruroides sculpturatus]